MTSTHEDRAERAAREFADAVVDLVGADGESTISTPEAEFDVVVKISPRRADAVALEVMIFGTEQVVVYARRPALGWWTFGGTTATADAWAVIQQIVDRGGQVIVEKRGNFLRHGIVRLHDTDGALIQSMEDGGAGPWKRITTFPPYRVPSSA
ncbi:hypothetical protein [Microbacterium sp. ABRD28]|uniref:hypothetical protein n=1 Tax=Microbacterium sp. ABRD28 TaxID=2268461 RepID=UPI000F555ED4|nr:hypothetical protein [Microbacterium sp. ABRD28]AZC13555.1 hypothetical protein DT073_07400 [Microbacterium sp. ABRD28]